MPAAVIFVLIDSQTRTFPLCGIPLCVQRERERQREDHHECRGMIFQTACIKISLELPHAKSTVVSLHTSFAVLDAALGINVGP